MRWSAFVILMPLLATGCSATPHGLRYNASDVGRSIDTTTATVLSSREVNINGRTTMIAPLVGGYASLTTADLLISGQAAGPIGILAGLVGAGITHYLQQWLSSSDGFEYLMVMDGGEKVIIVQYREDDEEPILDGSPVLVQMGEYTRVVPDPRAKGPSDDSWTNPDAPWSPTGGGPT